MNKSLFVTIELVQSPNVYEFELPVLPYEINQQFGIESIYEEEYFIVDSSFGQKIPQFARIDELNELAYQLQELSIDPVLFDLILETYMNVFEAVDSIGNWEILEMSDDTEFGKWIIREGMTGVVLPKGSEMFFDYGAFGRECRLDWKVIRANGYYAFRKIDVHGV